MSQSQPPMTAMDPDEIRRLREVAERQATPVKETKNSRAAFRRQVMREIVTPPHRDQQQHEGKRFPQGPAHEATDTLANTVFHRLGEAIRGSMGINAPAITGLHELYKEIESLAAESGTVTWCKRCGEEIRDCHCFVKAPRAG